MEIARTMPPSARQVNRDVRQRPAGGREVFRRGFAAPPEGKRAHRRVLLTGGRALSILRGVRDRWDSAERRPAGAGRGPEIKKKKKKKKKNKYALRRLEAAVEGRCEKGDAVAADLQAMKSDNARLNSAIDTASERLDRAIAQVKQMLEA